MRRHFSSPPQRLDRTIKFEGFTFRWNGDSYEARGREIIDDYGDPQPEPALIEAAKNLKWHFIDDLGMNADWDFGEKGYVYVWAESFEP
jgi:hypothetical protein